MATQSKLTSVRILLITCERQQREELETQGVCGEKGWEKAAAYRHYACAVLASRTVFKTQGPINEIVLNVDHD